MESVITDSVELVDLSSAALSSMWENMKTTYVIAHYNAAVELEFLKNWTDAYLMYQKSLETT
jgi:hypothetical protein